MDSHNIQESKCIFLSERSQTEKNFLFYDSRYMAIWKNAKWQGRKQITGAKVKCEGRRYYKVQHEKIWGNDTIVCYDTVEVNIYGSALQFAPIELSKASLIAQSVKNLSAMQETRVRFLGQEDPLEMGIATYSSILAWRIP